MVSTDDLFSFSSKVENPVKGSGYISQTLCLLYSNFIFLLRIHHHLDRVKRIWYLSHMRAAKVQASLRICAVSPEPSLLAHTSSESRGTFKQKARSLAPLNGWACAVEICHDGMLEDTNSLDGAHLSLYFIYTSLNFYIVNDIVLSIIMLPEVNSIYMYKHPISSH